MADEPPPYDPEADKDGDAGATATEQETKPKKEKVPDEPPPDGEGELGPPMKRVYFIGGSLAIWGILAFWMMVYWLASAIDPCRYQARTATCYTSDLDDCLEVEYANCEATYDTDTGRENWQEAYALGYGADSWEIRLVSWLVLTVGIGIGFFGAIASYFAVKKGNPCWNKAAYIMVGIGGFFTAVGGILLTASWNYDDLDGSEEEDLFNAVRATQLIEFLLVGVVGIIFAIDLQQLLLNDQEKRLMSLTVPIAVFSLFLGGCYAYIINWEPENADTCYYGVNTLLYDQMATISAGYFIIGVMCVVRILIAKEIIKLGDDPAKTTLYEFIISLILIIGGFICAVGYWATIDKTFDNDTECIVCNGSSNCQAAYWYVGILTYIYGDGVQPGILQGSVSIDTSTSFGVPIGTTTTTYDVKYESQFKSFYCGYSFFIFGIIAAIAYDMNIIGNYKKVRAAQSAASD